MHEVSGRLIGGERWQCHASVGFITNTCGRRREPIGAISGRHSVYIAVDEDTDRARRRLGESLQRFCPFFQSHHLEAFPVYGPPDACVRGLREVAEAGAELILLNPVFDEAEQMERLVAEVMPKLS